MPIKKRSASQAAKDRAALKRLLKSGIYRGKIDLRKRPTKYQLQKIASLKKARKLKKRAMPPKQKIPGARLKRTALTEEQVRRLTPDGKDHKLTTYALPFLRKGSDEPEWRRFTRKGLTQFLHEYHPIDKSARSEWASYAVKEEWVFDTVQERAEIVREANAFFSGTRINEPKGKIRKRVKRKKRVAKKRGR